jgi:hypothetical protein
MPLMPLTPQANYTGSLAFASATTTASTANPTPRGSLTVGTLPLGNTNAANPTTLNDVVSTVITVITSELVNGLKGLFTPATAGGNQALPATANLNQLQQSLNPNNDPALAELITLSAQDPEVAILMNDAAANGVTVRFGETEPNVNGFFQPTGNNTGFIVLSDRLRNSPTLEALPTLIHEMVHAATSENANSLLEEGVAEAFAETKAAELRNAFNVVPGRTFALPDVPALIQQRMNLYARLEPELREDNGILGDLQRMGISFVA